PRRERRDYHGKFAPSLRSCAGFRADCHPTLPPSHDVHALRSSAAATVARCRLWCHCAATARPCPAGPTTGSGGGGGPTRRAIRQSDCRGGRPVGCPRPERRSLPLVPVAGERGDCHLGLRPTYPPGAAAHCLDCPRIGTLFEGGVG